jgi:hypothetical protein
VPGRAESGALGHPFHIETRLTEQIPGQGDPGSGNGAVTVIPACAVNNRDRWKGYQRGSSATHLKPSRTRAHLFDLERRDDQYF